MIEKLWHYSLTNPASVYDEEALTALELAGRTAVKVNECVNKVNEIDEATQEAIEYMHTNIEETTERVITEKVENGEITIGIGYDPNIEALEIVAQPYEGGESYQYIADKELIDLL